MSELEPQDFTKIETTVVTGGCGFIGAHLVEHLAMASSTASRVVVLDKLSYASKGLERIREVRKKLPAEHADRIEVWTWDIAHPMDEAMLKELGNIRAIYHLAASTHVDNSIASPEDVTRDNVNATLGILALARRLPDLQVFLHFSTDEVYGECKQHDQAYSEAAALKPSNPYSASKAANEMVCIAYHRTYGLPLKTVRCMNVLGLMQDSEKFLPKVIKTALTSENSIGLHCDSGDEWGFRGYLSARDAASAAYFVAKNGNIGETYNVPCASYINNLELLECACAAVNVVPRYHPLQYDSERPGHDIGYALDGKKLLDLGWQHQDNDMHAFIQKCAVKEGFQHL